MKRYIAGKMVKAMEKSDTGILAEKTLPSGITEITDIPYIEDGHWGHLMDIYYPQDTVDQLPLIIDIHGGGFLYGNKELNKLYGYHLAQKGFAVCNMNYRLAYEDAKVPEQIRDISAALCWLSQNISKYPIDQDKVFIMGDSAGAVHAVMAVLISKSSRLQQVYDVPPVQLDFKAMALISGMMCFDKKSILYWGLRSICFDRGYKRQDTYKNMIFSSLAEIKDLPPVFLATSEEDELKYMTYDFENVLKENGVCNQLVCAPKVEGRRLGHVFSILNPDFEESDELINKMTDFFIGFSDKYSSKD